jgi:3-hydroxyisobutyrate dehydrogenase-like beta-hydroxyacid dehydrogenase
MPDSRRPRVAFIGLGQLGGLLCDHVLARGYDVTVYDPDPAAIVPRRASGARVAGSPADAARDCEIVCIVVRDDVQALEVVTGRDGVLDAIPVHSVVVLHSTVAPVTVRELYKRCTARSVRFADIPIGAGLGRERGEMYALCGADEATIELVRPVLACYAKHIVRFGDVGAGTAAKLARNLIQYSMWAVIHEGLQLADAAGIDRQTFAHLFHESGVTASHDMILGGAGSGRDARQLDKTVTLAWKDLDDAFALADEHGIATPLAHLARRSIGPALGHPIVPDE